MDDTWKAIPNAHTPKDISQNPIFVLARDRVNAEVERCTHTAQKFSKDGRVALFTISSGYQIHPVIATRWVGHLKSRNLQMVMVTNNTYHPSGLNASFSCRVSDDAYGKSVPPCSQDGRSFLERVGAVFTKGHKEATGGVTLTVNHFCLFL